MEVPNNQGFPTKNDHDLGCEMGVPPLKETPMYWIRISCKCCSLCFCGGKTGGLNTAPATCQGDSLKLDQCENDLGGPNKKRSEPGSETPVGNSAVDGNQKSGGLHQLRLGSYF